jgi:hypothetical protein
MVTNDDSLSECRPDDATLCSPRGVDLRETANDEALASTIGFSAGGALIGVGVIVFLTAPDSEEVATLTRIRPQVSGSGASLSWGGRW